MPSTNEAVAELLWEMADLLDIAGSDRFKIRAYENAARAVAGYPKDVRDLPAGELRSIPHVGRSIAEKIAEYVRTGTIAELEGLRGQFPPGVRPLLDVPGLGPRRALQLHRELGISSIEELQAAAERGGLRSVPGFGQKTEEKLLRAIEQVRSARGRIHLGTAWSLAEEVLEVLRPLRQVVRVEVAGSLRRMRDTIGDLDVLVASAQPTPVMDAFVAMPGVREVLARGETKSSVLTRKGVQVDLRVVPPEAWGAALVYFTGSKAHNVKIRERAVRMGLKLSEYGLFDASTGARITSETEEEVYEHLGLAWIPPTLREDRGEVEAAAAGELPEVVQRSDIRGDLHGHTDLTDGTATLAHMAAAAAELGYEYWAVTDHAPLLTMQRMTREKALEQRQAVGAVAARAGIAVLHGSELNIQPDGSLDWDDDFLAGFDVLVASVHDHFDMPRADMTARLLRAIEHPCVSVIGHPTTRRLGRRPPADFDADAVFEAAARTGTALEVNGSPERIDLPDDLVRLAKSHGVKFAVSTDAHAVTHLEYMRFGVGTAQRGWLTPDDVINAWPLADLRDFLARKRARRGR